MRIDILQSFIYNNPILLQHLFSVNLIWNDPYIYIYINFISESCTIIFQMLLF